MTTTALERGQFRIREGAESKQVLKRSVLHTLGGMVVGFLAEPRGGRHSANYLAAKSGEPSKNLARRVLSKLVGGRSETTAHQEEPVSHGRALGPFRRPDNWSAISRETLLGVQDLDAALQVIADTDSFLALEKLEVKLTGLADNSDALPEVQDQLDALAGTVRDKIDSQDPYTYIDPTRAARLERRGHKFAESNEHPTQQMRPPAIEQ